MQGKFGEAIPFLRAAKADAEKGYLPENKTAEATDYYFQTNRDLGAALLMNGESKPAVETLSAALAVKPTDLACLNLRASAYGQLRKWRKAIKDIDAYLAIRPKSDTAWINKGSLLEKRGKYKDAALAYDQALVYNPLSKSAMFGRATLLARKGQYQDALPDLDRLAKAEPTNKAFQLNFALGLYNTENLSAAVDAFTKVIALERSNTQALTLRGVCYFRQRNQFASCRDWTKAASLGDKEAIKALKKYCNNPPLGKIILR
jgi:tetratricopeptide (TPR) repeat protein